MTDRSRYNIHYSYVPPNVARGMHLCRPGSRRSRSCLDGLQTLLAVIKAMSSPDAELDFHMWRLDAITPVVCAAHMAGVAHAIVMNGKLLQDGVEVVKTVVALVGILTVLGLSYAPGRSAQRLRLASSFFHRGISAIGVIAVFGSCTKAIDDVQTWVDLHSLTLGWPMPVLAAAGVGVNARIQFDARQMAPYFTLWVGVFVAEIAVALLRLKFEAAPSSDRPLSNIGDISPILVPLAGITSYLACGCIEQEYWRPRWRRAQRSGAHLGGTSPPTTASPRCTRSSWGLTSEHKLIITACAAFTLAFWVAERVAGQREKGVAARVQVLIEERGAALGNSRSATHP